MKPDTTGIWLTYVCIQVGLSDHKLTSFGFEVSSQP